MKPRLESCGLERLRQIVALELGLEFSDDRLDYLASAAERRMSERARPSVESYLELVRSAGSRKAELRELAEALTVTETFFFRHPEQLRVFTQVVLERARRMGRRLNVLCAGCASGEEPYSLAMLLHETLPDIDAWDIAITGVDVNPAMLAKAERGSYADWSLRATAIELRSRYFEERGREFVLAQRVRDLVRFEELNLAEAAPAFWGTRRFDAIFCRNVLMYFTREMSRRVLARLGGALRPSAFLFLGHAETLRGVSDGYHLCHTHETFYYRKREPSELGPSDPPLQAGPPATFDGARAGVDGASSWLDAIQGASQRIEQLAARQLLADPAAATQRVTSAEGLASATPRDLSLSNILELVKNERFVEALDAHRALSSEAARGREALLLLAVLLTNTGAHAEAEATCRRLLALDELHAGAHYLMALCREQAGDRSGAIDHDRTAIYLDPSFSMPHLHLGLTCKRSGDLPLAERELSHALALLAREEPQRLILFGGGFSRDALLGLCRAELASAGDGL